MKILISGGHLTPALALIDYIQQHNQDKVVYVGRRYSQLTQKQISVEKDEVTKLGVKFISFNQAPKFRGYLPHQLLSFISSFLQSLRRAKRIVSQEKPDILLSFGGYLAVPLALMAWIKHIPIVTHEQTMAPGLANKLIGLLANKIAVSFPETLIHFKAKKVKLTGNPVRKAITQKVSRPNWYHSSSRKPLLLVMGGSQGSLAINQIIGAVLLTLLNDWQVVHVCGRATKDHHYFNELTELKGRLPQDLQQHYFVREWLSEAELSWCYSQAKLAICRAGANTVYELVLVKLPSILIPLPKTNFDEQTHNAQFLVRQGAAAMLSQQNLKPNILVKVIQEIRPELTIIKENLAKIKIERQGSEKLYLTLIEILNEQT